MAYDLEEQEQLASLTHWWRDYGGMLSWLALAGMLACAGWFGWKTWQRKEAAEAALLYEQVQKAVEVKDLSTIKRVSRDMESKFGRTAYGQMTALAVAKVLYEAADAAGAKVQLQWAIDHAKDPEFKAVARLRLAGVMLEEKAYDHGLALLSGDVMPSFEALYADRRGDLLVALNRTQEARAAYKRALEKIGTASAPSRQHVEQKLRNL